MASVSLCKGSQSCLSQNPNSPLLQDYRPSVLSIFSVALRELRENRFLHQDSNLYSVMFYVFVSKELKSIDLFPLIVLASSTHTCMQIGISSQKLVHMLCSLHEFRKLGVYFPIFSHSFWSPSCSVQELALLHVSSKESKKLVFFLRSMESRKQLQL